MLISYNYLKIDRDEKDRGCTFNQNTYTLRSEMVSKSKLPSVKGQT